MRPEGKQVTRQGIGSGARARGELQLLCHPGSGSSPGLGAGKAEELAAWLLADFLLRSLRVEALQRLPLCGEGLTGAGQAKHKEAGQQKQQEQVHPRHGL